MPMQWITMQMSGEQTIISLRGTCDVEPITTPTLHSGDCGGPLGTAPSHSSSPLALPTL